MNHIFETMITILGILFWIGFFLWMGRGIKRLTLMTIRPIINLFKGR